MVAATQFPAKPDRSSSLGSDYKHSVVNLPPPEKYADESPTEYRFRLLGLAQRVWGIHEPRLNKCHQQLAPNAGTVEVRRSPESGRASFRGLYQCNRGWTCPCCALRISNERREELTAAFKAAKALGWGVVLVTYTIQHTERDPLGMLWDAVQGAYSRFKGGDAYQDISDEYSVEGAIRALETLFGGNGWHPHIHELLFLKKPLTQGGINNMRDWFAERWIAQLEEEGFKADFKWAVDIRHAESSIVEYITKFGREPKENLWGADHEIAKLASKKSHSEGVTPFQLLEAFGEGDKRAAALFQEYAQAMEKRHRLQWSRGLRKKLALAEELSEEQLELPEEDTTYTAVEFDSLNWKKVCACQLHAMVLNFVAAGALLALRDVLLKKRIYAQFYDPSEIIVKPLIVELPGGPEIYEETTVVPVQLGLPGISTGGRYA